MDPLHINIVCKIIEENMEYETDGLLIQLVRLQQLTQSISVTLAADSVANQVTQIPVMMVVRSYQQQLLSFKSALPYHLQNDSKIPSRCYSPESMY
jgi:hypothetical protein